MSVTLTASYYKIILDQFIPLIYIYKYISFCPIMLHCSGSYDKSRTREGWNKSSDAAQPPVRWSQLGVHATYGTFILHPSCHSSHALTAVMLSGNGHPRPAARGFLHLVVLLLGHIALQMETVLSPRARAFALWTLVGYWGSVMFHLVPWSTQRSYSRALALDFMTICMGFTGHVGVLSGWEAPASRICVALSASMAALCFCGLFLQSSVPLWAFHRDTRKLIMLTMIAISVVVEFQARGRHSTRCA